VGKSGRWILAVALCGVGCASGQGGGSGGQSGGLDAGVQDSGSPDAGPADAGPADAGPPDAGPDGGIDAGPATGSIQFGTPGPWPIANVTYGAADGIAESPVVGMTTDEPVVQADGGVSQNLWVATPSALYVLRPGDKRFTRFDGNDGLHLPGFPAAACDDPTGTLKPCPEGDADQPGISEIAGGGAGKGYSGEVFVGYWAHHDWTRQDDGTWTDPWRHSGKLDRVRLKADASGKLSLEVIRFDMVSNNSPEFWHNKTVFKMAYDHFVHPHELYAGTDHGVTKFSPDKWKPNDPPPNQWFLGKNNSQVWRSDHLHPQACFHKPCTDGTDLRLADWRGLALDANGDLWVGGRYAVGKIRYIADNSEWWSTPRKDALPAISPAFGDPYDGNCSGSRPIFCPPLEGDPVNISAVTVAKDGKVWFASGTLFNEPGDVPYGIASLQGFHLTYFDPIRDVGLSESHVRDMLALPDGRLVVAGLNSGLVIWNPITRQHATMDIPDDRVLRIELDTMVDPPALHIATRTGATVLRILP